KKFLFHSSHSSTTAEQSYLPADQPAGTWKVILKREDRHEYNAEHRDGLFYIRTNRNECTNFKVVTCPVEKPDPTNWKDFVAYNRKVMVNNVGLYKNYAVVTTRSGGLP